MPTYRVTWKIDVEEKTPEAAVREARRAQLRESGIATVFEVEAHPTGHSPTKMDLESPFMPGCPVCEPLARSCGNGYDCDDHPRVMCCNDHPEKALRPGD